MPENKFKFAQPAPCLILKYNTKFKLQMPEISKSHIKTLQLIVTLSRFKTAFTWNPQNFDFVTS
jgi:hypothetical protein